jgi:hypothetical protein
VVDHPAFLDIAALLGDTVLYPVNVVADIDAIGDGALVVVFGDAVLVEVGDGLRRGRPAGWMRCVRWRASFCCKTARGCFAI